MKVLLILVDGMRPDSLTNIPLAQEVMAKSAHTLSGTTVFPSVTLPCHVSLFHSVDPSRHGTTTNTYAPQVRPIRGLCEVLKLAKKKSAFFYGWEQLRDLARPGSLAHSKMISIYAEGMPKADQMLAEDCVSYIKTADPDFTFLYLATTDETGHAHGWMSPEYMTAMEQAWETIGHVLERLPKDHVVIITADHGGHDRTHGSDLPEDMTIPMMCMGGPFVPGTQLENANLKDIAPTIAALLDAEPESEWEGKPLHRK